MNITPKNTIKGTNSDGSKFTLQEWDFATASNLEASGIVGMLIMSLLFCSIASPILLLFCVAKFNGRNRILHIIGLIVGAYFVFDCYQGWVSLSILYLFFGENTINTLIAVNFASALSHLILWLFGWNIYQYVTKKRKSDQMFYLVMIVVIMLSVGFVMSKKTTAKHKGWLEKTMKYVPPN